MIFWAGEVFAAGWPAFDLHRAPHAVEIFGPSTHPRPLCQSWSHLVLLLVSGEETRGKELEEMA